MADLTITASAVIPVSGYVHLSGVAGAAITAGQVVYVDTATSTIKLADADGATDLRTVAGISLHAALTGQPIRYITEGSLGLGAILTAGLVYVLSDVAGAIRPIADNGAADYLSIVGYASTTSNLVIQIINTGVVLA